MDYNFVGVLASYPRDDGLRKISEMVEMGEFVSLADVNLNEGMEEYEGVPEVSLVSETYGIGLRVLTEGKEERFVSDLIPPSALLRDTQILIKQGKPIRPYLNRYTLKYWDSKRGDVTEPIVEEGMYVSVDGDVYEVMSIREESQALVLKSGDGRYYKASLSELDESKVGRDKDLDGKVFKGKNLWYVVLRDDGSEVEVLTSKGEKTELEKRDFLRGAEEVKSIPEDIRRKFKRYIGE